MAKKKSTGKTNSDSEPTEVEGFESALQAVEEVVRRLESGELGLSESLAQYERGIEKIKHCHRALQQAEQRISVLISVDEDGTATVEPVETAPGDTQAAETRPPSKQPKRAVRKRPASGGDVDEAGGLF
jgi:exodeoxyribonuclease VII small subunit